MDNNIRLLEAILFTSSEPVAERALARRLPDEIDVTPLLEELKLHYKDRGINLVQAGGSWAFRSASDLSNFLNREVEVARKLGRATVETLAIIAYHQPVTRGEIEEIRGVSLSKSTFDTLFEQGWIRPCGRRQTPGRPTAWGTSDGFLDHFGLKSINDLPGIEELKSAGLLDKRPAIEAYHLIEKIGVSEVDVISAEDVEKEDEKDELPLAANLNKDMSETTDVN